MNRKVLFLLVALLGGAGVMMASRPGGGPQARAAVAAGARLVDVRTPEEFAAGHLPNAVNVPVTELEGRLAELGPKEASLVVYCRSGARSARAKRLLESAGFRTVVDLGAMGNW
jgi:phage shock protein E